MDEGSELLEKYRQALRGKLVSHGWRGNESAIFLEFGKLTPRHRKDGQLANPAGEYGLMIEGSWRIEEGLQVGCGSGSGEARWQPWLGKLVGRTVEDVETFGRLPEISMILSDGLILSSFTTSGGQPQWALFDHGETLPTLVSDKGRLCGERETASD